LSQNLAGGKVGWLSFDFFDEREEEDGGLCDVAIVKP
jgi:hypothetical protein